MAASVSIAAVSEGVLTGLLDALLRVLAREQKPRWLWPEGVQTAQHVLAAVDLDDLHARLDECIEERDVLPAEWLKRDRKEPVDGAPVEATFDKAIEAFEKSLEGDLQRLTPILGVAAAEEWARGWRGLVDVLRFVQALLTGVFTKKPLAANTDAARKPTPADAPRKRPLDFVYDPAWPYPIRRAVWDLIRGLIALLPIQHAFEEGRRLDPWVALALASTFAKGTKDFIPRIAANAFGDKGAGLTKERIESWVKEAVESGAPVYFPLGDAESG